MDDYHTIHNRLYQLEILLLTLSFGGAIKSCRGICRELRNGKSAFARRSGKHRGDSPYRLSCFCTTCDFFVFRSDLIAIDEPATILDHQWICPCCDGKNLRGLYKNRMNNRVVVRVELD